MKILIAGLAILLWSDAFSQLKKEQWLIGGSMFFSSSKSKELKFNSWQLSPAAGYFLIDKLAAGLRPAFNADRYKFRSDDRKNSTISLSPFIRYYFLPEGQNVNILGETSFGYSWTKQQDFGLPGLNKYTHYNFSVMTGAAIFLNTHTSVEITGAYSYLSRGPLDSTATSKVQIGIGLQIHLSKNY